MPDLDKNDHLNPLFEDTTPLVVGEFVDMLHVAPEALTSDNARVAVLGSGGRVLGVFISIQEFEFLEDAIELEQASRAEHRENGLGTNDEIKARLTANRKQVATPGPKPKREKFMALTCPLSAGGFPDECVFTVPIPDEVPYSGVTDRRYARSLGGDDLQLHRDSTVQGCILVHVLNDQGNLIYIHLPDRTTAWLRRSEIELHEPFPGWEDEAIT